MNLQPNSSAESKREAAPRAAGGRFPTRARLLKHADFEQVYKTGKKIFLPHLTVFYRGRAEGAARVGFTVSRMVGGAVVRNRIRRRLREATRFHLAGLSCAVDVVINPKKTAQTAEFAELCAEVGKAFEKVRRDSSRAEAARNDTNQGA